MNRKLIGLIVAVGVLAGAATVWAQTNLTVVRHADNTLWSMTCEGTGACSSWTQITGGFSVQPTLTWDPSIQKYILIGIGNNLTSIWRSTFNADGTWNNDWTKITGTSPSPVAVAGGAFGMADQIRVYDANNQYLGNYIVVVSPFDEIEVFIPSLKKQARIYTYDGNIGYRNLYFESGDCTGQAYSDNTAFMFHIWQTSGKYYTGATAIPIQITAHSYKYMDETCYSDNELLNVIPAIEITLPFTAPVALPMKLE